MLEIFDERVCTLGGSPFYNPVTDRVGWVDLPGSRMLWRAFDGGEAGEAATPEPVSAAVPRLGGGAVLLLADGPVLADEDGTLRVLGTFAEADALAGITAGITAGGPGMAAPAMRANDAKADPAGRLFVGTFALDGAAGAGALYRLDRGATMPRRVLPGVTVPNGLGWSPDGATFYFTDTVLGTVDAFDYALATGELSNRRLFLDFAALTGATAPGAASVPGEVPVPYGATEAGGATASGGVAAPAGIPARGGVPALGGGAARAAVPGGAMAPLGKPDGLCVDAAGGVWVACWGGGRVLRVSADGTVERMVEVPTPLVTSCAFAGPDLDTLIITTAAIRESTGQPGAGLVYRYRPGDVTGQPVGRYDG